MIEINLFNGRHSFTQQHQQLSLIPLSRIVIHLQIYAIFYEHVEFKISMNVNAIDKKLTYIS